MATKPGDIHPYFIGDTRFLYLKIEETLRDGNYRKNETDIIIDVDTPLFTFYDKEDILLELESLADIYINVGWKNIEFRYDFQYKFMNEVIMAA